MDVFLKVLADQGMSGVFIACLLVFIYKYVLPSFKQIAETNARQAESLVKVSENLASMQKDIPLKLLEAENRIISSIKEIQK